MIVINRANRIGANKLLAALIPAMRMIVAATVIRNAETFGRCDVSITVKTVPVALLAFEA